MVDVKPVSAPVSYPWYKVWYQALFHPSLETFKLILADPHAKAWRGFLWVVVSSLLVALLIWILVLQKPFEDVVPLIFQKSFANVVPADIFIFMPFLAIITLLLLTGIDHLIVRYIHGRGNFGQMIYAQGVIFAPAYIIFWTFNFIFVFLLHIDSFDTLFSEVVVSLVLGCYTVIQSAYAIAVAANITTRQAFFPSLISNMFIGLIYLTAILPIVSILVAISLLT